MNQFVNNLEEVDGIFLNPEDYRIPADEDEEVPYPTQELYQGDILGSIAETEARQNVQDKKKSQEQRARDYELNKHIKESIKQLKSLEIEVDGVTYNAWQTIWDKLVRTTLLAPINNRSENAIERILQRNESGVMFEALTKIQGKIRYFESLSIE